MAIKRYLAQSTRGKQGFGYIAVEDGYVKSVERFTTEDEFLKSLKKEDASELLIHHRAPTSTGNFIDCTHPVVVDDPMFKYKYYLIHNGVLQNELGLKRDHEGKGLEYNTEYTKVTTLRFKNGNTTETTTDSGGFLDSESLAKEFALYIEGHKESIGAIGSIAFMCYQTDQEGKILNFFYGRNLDRELIVEQVERRKKKKKNRKEQDGEYTVIKSQGNGVPIYANKLFRVEYPDYQWHQRDCKVGATTWANHQVGFDTNRVSESITNIRDVLGKQYHVGTPDYRDPDDRVRYGMSLLPEPKRELVWNERSGVMEEAGDETTINIDDAMVDIENRALEHSLKEELSRIEEEMINEDSDLQIYRDEFKKATTDSDRALCMQEIHDKLEDLKKLRSEKVDVENMLRDMYEGIVSPYAEEVVSRMFS